MNIYIGTSGFSYKEWRGAFYPGDLPGKQMLRYYADHFMTVEINNTFYRMLSPSVLEVWRDEVPPGFRFALKAPRQITHIKRLKDTGDAVSYLLEVTKRLNGRLGPLLFQLPPHLKKDAPRLRDFLALLPAQRLTAFEFRHSSWFDDEVYELLRGHRSALCIVEAEDDFEVPFVATANWGYLRLRRADYGDSELGRWAKLVQGQDWREVFVFFKHEDEGKSPLMANRFRQLTAQP